MTNNKHWTDWRRQTAAKMHKAADQINSLLYNMNLLAQTPFKVEPRLIRKTPEIRLTNLEMKQISTTQIQNN